MNCSTAYVNALSRLRGLGMDIREQWLISALLNGRVILTFDKHPEFTGMNVSDKMQVRDAFWPLK